jgi:hypothetical protein
VLPQAASVHLRVRSVKSLQPGTYTSFQKPGTMNNITLRDQRGRYMSCMRCSSCKHGCQ